MWFRRKKKPDPDSALTETLRSLQVLLEDDEGTSAQTPAKQVNTNPNKSVSQAVQAETNTGSDQKTSTGGSPSPIAREQSVVVEANSDVHATSEGSVDQDITDNPAPPAENAEVPRTEARPSVGDPPPEVNNEHEDAEADLITPLDKLDDYENKEESTWVDPFRQEGESPVTEDLVLELDSEDLADQDVEVPAIDTIPVLTKIVFEPVTPTADETKSDTVDREMLLEVCVNDLRERLRQNRLSQMDREQEERLRHILTHILGNKSTDHSS